MVCVAGGGWGVAAAAAAAATNILQVHINWLWEAGSRGNSIIRKVDEDRKLDGSHLRQKTAPPRQPSGGEASLCIINELPSARRSAAVLTPATKQARLVEPIGSAGALPPSPAIGGVGPRR